MGVTPERLLWAGGCLLVVVASSATGFLAKNPVIAQVAKQEVSGSDPFRVLGSTRKVLLVGAGSSAHSRNVKLQRWGTADLVLLVTIEPSERVLGVEAIPSTMKVGERSLAEVFESDGPEAVLSMGGLEALLSMGGIIATDYAVLDFDSMISFIDRMGGIEVKVEQKLQHVDKAGGAVCGPRARLLPLGRKVGARVPARQRKCACEVGRHRMDSGLHPEP